MNVWSIFLGEINSSAQIPTVSFYLLHKYPEDFEACTENEKDFCAKFSVLSNKVFLARQMQFEY